MTGAAHIFQAHQVFGEAVSHNIFHAVNIDHFNVEAVERAAHDAVHTFKLFLVAKFDFSEFQTHGRMNCRKTWWFRFSMSSSA